MTANVHPTRRNSERAAKRDPERAVRTILKAARREFHRVGYDGARVDRIAERSKLSKGLIYHYFGSKEDLFRAVLEQLYEELRGENENLILDDFEPEEGIRQLVSHTFRYFAANPEFIVLVNSENIMRARHIRKSKVIGTIFKPLNDRLGELIGRGVEAGIFRRDVDTTELYISIVALGYFSLSNRYTLGIVFDRELASEEAMNRREAHITDIILGYLRSGSRLP